ncbi:TetR/AcrR family transcriptional regulator [Oerskovia sp. Root22]|uniref:TetR/AcrR family transcriptional regulator n=1 Tax=Oerskovia sp. Root22 TaxID=1736494 RepID=UPI0006F96248|nr:TetR/AcrR family transcriptional regulator [Oerskovia sp. Root22]KRC31755.1 TetR family transcriptional regulator [Oerskovia sp. Root22]
MTAEEAREKIVDAADRLYYAKGYAAVGMDELRRESGVSLRRLYATFPSKDDIVLAVLARKHEQWERGITERVEGEPDPRARLLAIYDYLADWFCADDFRGCAFINAFGELGTTHPAVADAVRTHKASFERFVARLVDGAGAPPALAGQLVILAEGAQTTAAISGDPAVAARARAAAETLVDAALGMPAVSGDAASHR